MDVLLLLLLVLVVLGVSFGGAYLISIAIVRRLLKPKSQTVKTLAYAGTFTFGFLLIITGIGWIILSHIQFGR